MINNTICFVAGKSGGHIIPCLTLAKEFYGHNKDQKTVFFSANTPLDMRILANNRYVSSHIPLSLSSIQTRSFWDYIKIIYNLFHSFFLSFYYLIKHKPSKVITTGGIVAIPTCYAAFLLRIPIIIHCLDAVPGKALKAIAPLSSSINVCFSQAQKFFTTSAVTPYPIQYQKQEIDGTNQALLSSLGLDNNKKTVAILGGSQGSLFLNECMKLWVIDPSFSRDSLQIIHQTGSIDATNWNAFYKHHHINAHVFSYQSDLSAIYTVADIIVCRAGAGTLFEIVFFNKKCIIIPLKTETTTHQIDNARAIAAQFPHLFHLLYQEAVEKDKTILFKYLQDH